MKRTPLWHSIQTTLSDQIAQGAYLPGAKLPTEAELAARFGVNRHTVRRALGEIAKDGSVYPCRGSGVFVAQVPTGYPIGKRVRFRQNVRAADKEPGQDILLLEARLATAEERSR